MERWRVELRMYADDEGACARTHNVPLYLANALQRALHELPASIAFSFVDIWLDGDDSPYGAHVSPDMLAHRIGLLPLDATRVDALVPAHMCPCETHCSRCSVEAWLDETNTDARESRPVYASSLMLVPDAPTAHVAPDVLLTLLAPRATLRVSARAIRADGRLHARHAIAVNPHLLHVARVRINSSREAVAPLAVRARVAAACHEGVLSIEDAHLCVRDADACTQCGECARAGADLDCDEALAVAHAGAARARAAAERWHEAAIARGAPAAEIARLRAHLDKLDESAAAAAARIASGQHERHWAGLVVVEAQPVYDVCTESTGALPPAQILVRGADALLAGFTALARAAARLVAQQDAARATDAT